MELLGIKIKYRIVARLLLAGSVTDVRRIQYCNVPLLLGGGMELME